VQNSPAPNKEDIALFQQLLNEHRYDFCKLVYLIFPFGEPGHALEHMAPYDWQMEEWAKLSRHLMNPLTRYQTYRLIISSGNGAAKTAFGAMTLMMLMYTQKLRARLTANTDPQMKSIVWPEYDIWYRHARFHEHFFEKFGTSIKAKKEDLADTWRIDTITWSAESPQAISGLHNKGHAVAYVFEEAPGIPANIWQYAAGAFTETETIKLFLAFGNSDDPESKFEQNMASPLWNARRIDTRTLNHIDPKQIEDWLLDCGGDEDADDFRVRVRGLPRKTSRDSIIRLEVVQAALARRKTFDKDSVAQLPVVLGCDPAWTGGDSTTIWYKQGHYRCLLEFYKLDKTLGENHMLTYQKLCHWERTLHADAVHIDQGEGTAVYTLGQNAGKTSWVLVSFAGAPNDKPEVKESEYANIRAQMYYETGKDLASAVLDAREEAWIPVIEKQLCWTKGGRHKVTQKKIAEPKIDIKTRVGQSPDVADGCVLLGAHPVTERLPENDPNQKDMQTGSNPWRMPELPDPYETMDADYERLYD
jgi:hypothetical protein